MHLLKKVWLYVVVFPIVTLIIGITILTIHGERMEKERLAIELIKKHGYKYVKITDTERMTIGNSPGTYFSTKALDRDNERSYPGAFIPDDRKEKEEPKSNY